MDKTRIMNNSKIAMAIFSPVDTLAGSFGLMLTDGATDQLTETLNIVYLVCTIIGSIGVLFSIVTYIITHVSLLHAKVKAAEADGKITEEEQKEIDAETGKIADAGKQLGEAAKDTADKIKDQTGNK